MRLSNKKLAGIFSGIFVTVAIFATAVALATASFGPSRPTYTWANPADHITFNSITDNPQWGDERQLLKARDLTSPTSDYAPSTKVHDGEDVVLAIYFHNDAASDLNLVAHNTTAKFVLPTNSATTLSPTAYISASNATPGEVFATADLTGDRAFTVSYEPGTAKLYTNYVNGVQISDNVVGSGTLIGTNGVDGNVPGCSQYSGFVTVRVKVSMPTPTPTPTPTQTQTQTQTQTVSVAASGAKALPNTGPGEMAGLFAGTSVLGTAGHYLVTRRRR